MEPECAPLFFVLRFESAVQVLVLVFYFEKSRAEALDGR